MRSLAAVVPFEYERFQCVFVLQHLLVHTDGLENRASEDNVHWLDKCLRAGFVRSFVLLLSLLVRRGFDNKCYTTIRGTIVLYVSVRLRTREENKVQIHLESFDCESLCAHTHTHTLISYLFSLRHGRTAGCSFIERKNGKKSRFLPLPCAAG